MKTRLTSFLLFTVAVCGQTYPDQIAPGVAIPNWSGGLLTSWRADTPASNPTPNLVIADRQGPTVGRHWLWMPEASAVKIFDASAGASQQVAVVGLTTVATGQYSGYLAIVDPRTNATKVISTAPFEGQHVRWGPHDSIWVLGYQLTADRKLLTAPPHSLLRQYDHQGRLIAEHLPWPAINCGRHPLLGEAQLTTSSAKIGVLLSACQSWLELSPTGELLGRWPAGASLPKGLHTPRAVMTPAGEAYLMAATPETTLFRLAADRRAWEMVPHDPALWCLAGADADGLAFCSGANSLAWVKR